MTPPQRPEGAERAGRRVATRVAAGRSAHGDPLASALHEVGDRWTLLIVNALLGGPRRFNDLQSEIGGIATNVLAKRLEQLEQRALVVAMAYSARPPRFEYELTGAGYELAGALRLLRSWGALREGRSREPGGGPTGPEHAACGTALEPRWWCPTCASVADDPQHDEGDLRFL